MVLEPGKSNPASSKSFLAVSFSGGSRSQGGSREMGVGMRGAGCCWNKLPYLWVVATPTITLTQFSIRKPLSPVTSSPPKEPVS